MFAASEKKQLTKSADKAPTQANSALGQRDATGPKSVWQSLALNRCGVQPKLTDRLIRMPTPFVQRTCGPCATSSAPCSECEEEEREGAVQRKADHDGPQNSSSENLLTDLGSGRALDLVTRAFFEPRFGHDFSRIRVHTGMRAAQSAQALSARAFTVGQDIVFGKDQYVPDSAPGRFLLAHELTHVVQQGERKDGAANTLIQRDTRTSIPLYEPQEVGGSVRQVQTTRTQRGLALPVSYDAATSVFTVTFRLAWIFPHTWSNAQRNAYVQSFEASVRRVWNDRFLLSETRAPRRTAHVQIRFDNFVIPQMANQTVEVVQLGEPQAWGRWRMDVRTLNVRANVDRGEGVVQLGQTSMDPHRRTPAELRRDRAFFIRGTGDNRTYTQAAAPHEFGHMIGLGDEYLEDAGEPIPSAVRGHINSRIMNVGEEVTPDAYAPFAAWLSELTLSTWRVGHRVP